MQNLKTLAIFCGCTARFLSDLVGNLEDRFSHNEAQFTETSHPGDFECLFAIMPIHRAIKIEVQIIGLWSRIDVVIQNHKSISE